MYNGEFYYREFPIPEDVLVPTKPLPSRHRAGIENHEDDDTENPDYPLNEPWFEAAIEENGNTVEDIVSDDEEFTFTDGRWITVYNN